MNMTPFIKDSLERAAWTFVQGFLVVVLVSGSLDITVVQSAGMAGLMAVAALVKAIAAKRLGAQTPQLGVQTYK